MRDLVNNGRRKNGGARDRAGPGAGPGGAGRGLARSGRPRGPRQVSRAERRGGRAGMAEQWDLDEEGIRRLGALTLEQPGRARPGA